MRCVGRTSLQGQATINGYIVAINYVNRLAMYTKNLLSKLTARTIINKTNLYESFLPFLLLIYTVLTSSFLVVQWLLSPTQ